MSIEDLPAEAYRQSYAARDGAEYWLEKVGTGRQLVVKAEDAAAYQGFAGTTDGDALRADITPDNALELRNRLPWLCLLYTSPSPRDGLLSRMPSSA